MNDTHTIVPVRTHDHIAAVAALAREIWTEHYVPFIGRPQVDYMLDRFQSAPAVAAQLADGCEYFLGRNHGVDAGYCAAVPDAGEEALKLSKIYVRRACRGRGLGRAMLAHVEALGRDRGLTRLWLTANKHNHDSLAWYTRMGFVHAGATVQDIGHGFVMDDYIMEKPLRA